MLNWTTRNSIAAVCIALAPALTGCTRTYSVPKTRPPDIIFNAPLDRLIAQMNERYNAIQTMTATVEIQATVGASRQGHATDYPAFSGYIFMRKPEDIRVILLVPVLRSQALDMVSDGKQWKLWIPPKNRAMEGSNEVSKPSPNAIENLRPAVFFDSLLVRDILPSQIVSLTSDIRILQQATKKSDIVEEPDYDIEVLNLPSGQVAHTQRVVHISSADLLPYQQDIYNPQGQVVTRAFYSGYQKFNNIDFPTHILIRRPLDQLSLSVTITKLTMNQNLDNDQFDLKIPDTVPMQKMN